MATQSFPVEFSHILMFARSIGDENPAYTDPTSAAAKEFGGVLAPPTFVQASAQFDADYPLRPKLGEPWFGSGAEPSGATIESTGRLHAEQHYEYHRPLVAGEVLRSEDREGATWEKESKRGGTLLFQEMFIDYFSVEHGDLVVTARAVSVLPSTIPSQS